MGETTPTPKLTLESLCKDHPEIIEALRTEIENSAAMKEAQAQQEKKLKETEMALEAAKAEIARFKAAQTLVEAKILAEEVVKEAQAEVVVKEHVVKEAVAALTLKEDGTIDKEAFSEDVRRRLKETVALVAAARGAGRVEGMGAGAPTGQTKTLEETDKELVAGFMRLGMSEAEAKAAVKGA